MIDGGTNLTGFSAPAADRGSLAAARMPVLTSVIHCHHPFPPSPELTDIVVATQLSESLLPTAFS